MNSRRNAWLWFSAAVLVVVGLLLVSKDSAAGWFLIILGLVYVGASTPAGRRTAASHPGMVRWGLVAASLLLILLAIVAGAIVLYK
jgi:hypothetical protein